MAESTQHKLSRVRPPRVQITYDVEIGDAIEKKELPYIVGIMSDLSGKPAEALPPVKDRKFVEIDRDNFQDVLSSIAPRVAFRVPNRLQPDSNDVLNVELRFKHMDDFGPVEVLKQVPTLKRLFEARSRLRDLLTKLDGNDDLDALLKQVMQSTEEQEALKTQLAGPAPSAPAASGDAPPAEPAAE
ncbi:type VI secretion system contractile sheath small subunit [Azospirillum agricola]|uniref:type VI secretion system contractile sheath small subunit n=1 Tax=Azospirillum agricola TaxID=1720247 RepID=UPI000A0F32BC|nr:type VI secretion system contractile sheath small subunit [Azospirillum agricola]SMH63017.1 type VI secretion system protein ImpB [Azospirillum lipoferum]